MMQVKMGEDPARSSLTKLVELYSAEAILNNETHRKVMRSSSASGKENTGSNKNKIADEKGSLTFSKKYSKALLVVNKMQSADLPHTPIPVKDQSEK